MRTTGGPMPGYGSGRNDGSAPQGPGPGERGSRRMRLAAMAGTLYRSGAQAVNDIRDQYAQTHTIGQEGPDGSARIHIPGAFPDVAITVQGGEQMVLFPSYAKRHTKREREYPPSPPQPTSQMSQGSWRDEEYWRQEWERNEDEKAIVDVDVRGWVYSPQTGPMNRRNRMLIGLARRLSGVTAPRGEVQEYDSPTDESIRSQQQLQEAIREEEKIEREAAQIERKGQEQKRVAARGGYSERPPLSNGNDGGSMYPYKPRRSPMSAPSSPTQSSTQYSTGANEMTEAELALANANLMARIAPFMTNPMVALPITVFFYNDTQSQSRTVITNDAGHFILRAALDFVPTHVRVLANEKLSTVQEVQITEPHGISLISDVDDTIKMSNISGGAREIFRNTFIRNLSDLTVDGVQEWYNELHQLGVSIHYCSNSPWQLYPVLASYLKLAGLPPGSLHLKQYSGMMQGIFEPVAERKKTTLDRLLRDFPQRRFILVGDSGEADLEVYTDLATANPGRVLAIFIRDVTTPETTDFFDPSINMTRQQTFNATKGPTTGPPNPSGGNRQNSFPVAPQAARSKGPTMGTLIDFVDEPKQEKLDEAAALRQVQNSKPAQSQSAVDLLSARKPAPPRPAKPVALRSSPSNVGLGVSQNSPNTPDSETPPPQPPRKPVAKGAGSHPLTQMHNNSQQSLGSNRSGTPQGRGSQKAPPNAAGAGQSEGLAPPPPPPRRRGTPGNLSPRMRSIRPPSDNNSDIDFEPLPPPTAPRPPQRPLSRVSTRSGRSPQTSPTGSPRLGAQGVNRKLDLWQRQLARAHEQLDHLGVPLYTWRRGQDVVEEAVGIVQQATKEMERNSNNKR